MSAKIIIDKDQLYDLYINQNKTYAEVSKILNVGTTTIIRNLRKFGITKDKKLILANMQRTCLAKYGVVNYRQTKEYNIKLKDTCLNKYGIEHYSKTNEYKDKCKKTCLQKYGTDNYSKLTECKNRVKKTNIAKYGTEYYTQTEEYKNKKEQTCLKNYGFKSNSQSPICKEKTQQTCLAKYGKNSYTQTKTFIEQCKKKSLEENGVEYHFQKNIQNYDIWQNDNLFIEKVKELKNTKALSKFFNVDSSAINLRIISTNSRQYIEQFRSYPEIEISELLDSLGINYTSNTREIITPFELDFYIPEHNMAIEFNGTFWHNSEYKANNYHQKKSMLAEEKGIFIYHIWQNEWDNNRDRIINQLKNLFHLNKEKIYARKCEVKVVNPKDSREFLEQNHIQGFTNAKIHIGLYYNDELISLMLFGKPIRQNIKYDWELKRFCSKANYNVIGGASKLFKHFVNNYQGTIISYSDIAKTQGNLYKVLGFTLDHITVPNYKYCDSHSNILLKISCKKSNLKKLGFDTDNKTESEIMNERGYWKIFDAGLKVWTYTR